METQNQNFLEEFEETQISRRLSNDISYEKTKKLFKVFFVKKINQPELIPYMHTTYKILCEKYENRLYLEQEAYQEYMDYLKKESIDPQFINNKLVKQFNQNKKQYKINALIILGGDGTVLHACSLFQFETTPPILAFNKVENQLVYFIKGTLSFMCNYNFQEYEEIVESIFSKIQKTKLVKVDVRMRLDCKIYQSANNKRLIHGHYSALNDIVIDRGSNPSPIKLEIAINNEQFTIATGDGIIISTPSGSSAYALSAGGPLIHSSVKTIEMTPVCPLSLSFRPILFPDNLSSGSRNTAFLSADGKKKHEVGYDDIIQISGSQFNVQIISEPPLQQLISLWGEKLQYMLNWNTKFEPKKYQI